MREFSRQSRSRERPYTVQSYKTPSMSAFAPGGAKLADFGLEIDALLYDDATKYATWSSFPSAFLWQNHRSTARPAQVGSEVAQGSAFRGR